MSETKLVRINGELWTKLRKVVANYDFSIDDLVELILRDVDLEDYAKELASKAKAGKDAEERAVEEAEEEVDEEEATAEAEDEEASAEEADDVAENKY
jgi:hypothetical protein